MKSFMIKMTALLACVATVITATLYLAEANDGKAVAIVVKSTGKAQAKQGNKWVDVTKGSRLFSGDKVVTKDDGFAAVMFLDDKSIIKLKPNSNLEVKGQYEGKSISKNIVMDVGELFVKVSKQKGSFQVATPTSVASVKGTEFWVIENTNGTKVIGIEGLIEVLNKASNKKQDVSAGNTANSDKSGNLSVDTTKENEIPEDKDLEEIIIKFRDNDGKEKEVKIKY